MKCTNCGTEFEGKFCTNCGKPVNETVLDSNSKSQNETKTESTSNVSKSTEGSTSKAFILPEPELQPQKKKKPVRLMIEIIGCILLIILAVSLSGKVPEKDYNSLKNDYDTLSKANEKAENELKKLRQMETEYNEYKKRMEPYEDLQTKEAEARKIEAEKVAAEKKAAEEKAAAEKKAAEEKAAAEAAAAKAAEEARGYETGITYDQLARTPDDFTGQKVKFYGKVIQVMEDGSDIQIRLAVDDNYDTILYGQYSSSIVTSRILEDDYITIYGTSVGTISYTSTLGGTITIPGVYIDKIDQ
ncbi:MAG: hypothetical protein MSA90_22255 [Faecalicatena sp.]|uniref:hypothetical protein n=1 Tax=Faecalicatena sp. TaxID=2005360 RepID=UPI002589108C|nr:hypothetical protein [Faecalicatena sp.]MCI6468174.1 hypothetical protein [Faecalicatena sp.]MDY5620429.1 hypothetical protein [Lachnospiraceae bacterium]